MGQPDNVVYPYPDGGMNEMYPAHLIPDNTFCDLVNMYYDRGGKLVSRPGTEYIASFNDYIYSFGAAPSLTGSPFTVQSGRTLYGRVMSSVFGDNLFHSIATTSDSGYRYTAVMNSCLYSGCSNGSATTDNLKWDPTTTTAVTWPGSPPAFSYVCTWNGRMWAAHRNLQTRLYFSAVGDPEDWSTAGVSGAGYIDVGYSDGESITGLIAHNEQLFIFKERSVYHIVTGNPNTDNTRWRVERITDAFGCSNNRGLFVVGNNIMVPTTKGYTSLNAALYQGDFSASSASEQISYTSGASAIRSFSTGQHLIKTGNDRYLYSLQRNSDNTDQWSRMRIYDYNGRETQIICIGEGLFPPTTYGADFRGPQSAIAVYNFNTGYFDLLQYPTTYTDKTGHYDYINGPNGTSPIRKYFKTKEASFGSTRYEKRSRQVGFVCRKNDRDTLITGDDLTITTTFDGDTNHQQSTTVTDVGADVNTSLRGCEVALGGSEGITYRTIQHEVTQNIGGYQLEYAAMEMDVEKLGRIPRPSDKVLS